MDVTPVARPRIDGRVREIGFHQLCCFERFFDIVDGQHRSPGFADLGRFENGKAARIAEKVFVAELIDKPELIRVILERRERIAKDRSEFKDTGN